MGSSRNDGSDPAGVSPPSEPPCATCPSPTTAVYTWEGLSELPTRRRDHAAALEQRPVPSGSGRRRSTGSSSNVVRNG